ncbi:hypothetical protein BD769DRAFT_1481449 [Suillus cothurnatus]|nr:hypothetical protein BD769DRAFT_1481449 [Suillus cothurnatus]
MVVGANSALLSGVFHATLFPFPPLLSLLCRDSVMKCVSFFSCLVSSCVPLFLVHA